MKTPASFPVLETKRTVLRHLTLDDAAQIFQLRSDETVNEYIDRPVAGSIDDAIAFINKITQFIQDQQTFYWAIVVKDEFTLAGTITLWNFDHQNNKAEIGYELLPSYHGKGLMQEVLKKVVEFGFEQLQLSTIEAWTHPHNIRSSSLLEKIGFKKEKLLATIQDDSKEIIYFLKSANYSYT